MSVYSVCPSVRLSIDFICPSISFVRLSFCPFACVSVYSPVTISVYSVSPYVRLFRRSVCPSVLVSVCSSVRLSVCPSDHLPVCLSVRLFAYQYIHLSVRPSFPSVRLFSGRSVYVLSTTSRSVRWTEWGRGRGCTESTEVHLTTAAPMHGRGTVHWSCCALPASWWARPVSRLKTTLYIVGTLEGQS